MPRSSLHRFTTDARWFPLLASLYPPLLGAGIRVRRVSPDWTHGELTMRVHRWTANPHGAAFGGALFSATDVLYGSMLAGQLGGRYQVWTRSATIEFVAPGRGVMRCDVEAPAADTERIRQELETATRTTVDHLVDLVDSRGRTVARAEHRMHVRKR